MDMHKKAKKINKKYFIYFLIFLNIIIVYFMYNFINYYTVQTFNADAGDIVLNSSVRSNKLNNKNFNEIIEGIKQKQKKENIDNNIKNIFK